MNEWIWTIKKWPKMYKIPICWILILLYCIWAVFIYYLNGLIVSLELLYCILILLYSHVIALIVTMLNVWTFIYYIFPACTMNKMAGSKLKINISKCLSIIHQPIQVSEEWFRNTSIPFKTMYISEFHNAKISTAAFPLKTYAPYVSLSCTGCSGKCHG